MIQPSHLSKISVVPYKEEQLNLQKQFQQVESQKSQKSSVQINQGLQHQNSQIQQNLQRGRSQTDQSKFLISNQQLKNQNANNINSMQQQNLDSEHLPKVIYSHINKLQGSYSSKQLDFGGALEDQLKATQIKGINQNQIMGQANNLQSISSFQQNGIQIFQGGNYLVNGSSNNNNKDLLKTISKQLPPNYQNLNNNLKQRKLRSESQNNLKGEVFNLNALANGKNQNILSLYSNNQNGGQFDVISEFKTYGNQDILDNIAASNRLKNLEKKIKNQNLEVKSYLEVPSQSSKNASLYNLQSNQNNNHNNNNNNSGIINKSQSAQKLNRNHSNQIKAYPNSSNKDYSITHEILAKNNKPFKLTELSEEIMNQEAQNDITKTNFQAYINRTNNQILKKDYQDYDIQQPGSESFKTRFVKQIPVSTNEMVYNVNFLLRMKKIKEQQLEEFMEKPKNMIEYIKRRNKIDMAIQNAKKLKKLEDTAEFVEQEINKQEERINKIIDQMLSKFDIYKQ